MAKENKSGIVLFALAIVVAVVAAGVVLLMFSQESDSKPESKDLNKKDQASAVAYTKKFIEEAGNYGIKKESMDSIFTARAAIKDPNNYVSQGVLRDKIMNEYYVDRRDTANEPTNEVTLSNLYTVETKIHSIKSPKTYYRNSNEEREVRITVSIESKLSWFATTQGYLEEDGTPAKQEQFFMTNTFIEPAGVIVLVERNGVWRIKSLEDFKKVKILATQEVPGFHDDVDPVNLPEPNEKTKELASSFQPSDVN